jgi:hypothetical protein
MKQLATTTQITNAADISTVVILVISGGFKGKCRQNKLFKTSLCIGNIFTMLT